VYIYIHIYIHIYTYIYIYIHTYIYTHTHTHKRIFLSNSEIEGCQRKRTPLQEFVAFEKKQTVPRTWLLEVNLKPLLGSVETNDSTSFGEIQGSIIALLLGYGEGTENGRVRQFTEGGR
jgi:hypothetical protein